MILRPQNKETECAYTTHNDVWVSKNNKNAIETETLKIL